MAPLLLKLLLVPLLLAAVSIAGTRFGPRVAGVLMGLPLVGGPLALEPWGVPRSFGVALLAVLAAQAVTLLVLRALTRPAASKPAVPAPLDPPPPPP